MWSYNYWSMGKITSQRCRQRNNNETNIINSMIRLTAISVLYHLHMMLAKLEVKCHPPVNWGWMAVGLCRMSRQSFSNSGVRATYWRRRTRSRPITMQFVHCKHSHSIFYVWFVKIDTDKTLLKNTRAYCSDVLVRSVSGTFCVFKPHNK